MLYGVNCPGVLAAMQKALCAGQPDGEDVVKD